MAMDRMSRDSKFISTRMVEETTIALCFPVCNNLPILRSTLIHNMQWADQVCIVDMNSDDGTHDFLQAVLRPQDRYDRMTENIIPKHGFAFARNLAADLAGTDWIWHGASNCCLDWRYKGNIHGILQSCKADVLASQTINIEAQDMCIEKAAQQAGKSEWHRHIHRRGVGVEMKGYIHEELYRGEANCYHEAEARLDIREFHFVGRGYDELRACRAAWMLRRAADDPTGELRKYTNEFWYSKWVPERREDIHRMAENYQRGGLGQ